MILTDYSGIAMAAIFAHGAAAKADEAFIRHIILNSLRMYNLKYRERYGKMILACDSRSWRKDVFAHYKAARKKHRESDSGTDWKAVFETLSKVREEIREHMPYAVISVDGAEADDVIGTLVESTQEFGAGEDVMIISADKDFIQLQKYSNVSQFSPLTKKVIKHNNPADYLLEHIIRGDSGDGVPNILSADDTFVFGGRQSPVRASLVDGVRAAKKNGSLHEELRRLGLERNYSRNATLIDLSLTPQNIKDSIRDLYINYKYNGNGRVLNYLIANRCNMLVSSANEFFTK